MEWGGRVEFLINLAKQEAKSGGLDVPPALANRPKIYGSLQKYYDAFNKVNSSRTWTMGGPAAIPMTQIESYLRVFRIRKAEECEDHVTFIQALDNTYLEWQAKKKPTPPKG